VVRAAEAGSVQRVELTIEMTAAGEAFLAHWSSPAAPEEGTSWLVVHTLHSRGIPLGVLRLAGTAEGGCHGYLDHVQELVQLLEGHLQAAVAPPAAPVVVAAVPPANESAGHRLRLT
jgi:hypothetical protein